MNTTPDSERGTPGWSITLARRVAVGRGALGRRSDCWQAVASPVAPISLRPQSPQGRYAGQRAPNGGSVPPSWRAPHHGGEWCAGPVPPLSHPLRGESRDGRDRRQRVPMHTRAALPAVVDCVANRDGAGSRIHRGGVLRPSARPAGRAALVMAGTMLRGACREGSSSRSTLALGVDGGRRPGVCRAPDAPPPAGFFQSLSSFLQDGSF